MCTELSVNRSYFPGDQFLEKVSMQYQAAQQRQEKVHVCQSHKSAEGSFKEEEERKNGESEVKIEFELIFQHQTKQ